MAYGLRSSSDVQNNLALLNSRIVSQKRTVILFLSLVLALPVQASDNVQNEQANKAPRLTLSKKTKIKQTTDLRVIVDISGSMKKTDPNNLRRPAVRLLAGLIPQGSRAGIWNFGKQVNMTVKIGTVDDAWRDLARQQSKEINSVGLYTNIENAMRKVSFDWKKPDPRYKRNLILLTDGHVDVSQDDKLDKASRKRILKELLPEFEKAKVRIHTIALSDDVDESLLSTLSAYTDGLYKKVSSADDLQKLFLQMLEQSVNLDTLPLKDNRFNVDANINDMTLLVFNKDSSHPTKIVTPGKRTWSQKTHADQVKWFNDDGFDLITIKKPQQGQWKIMAPVDENNRVVVATNLKLRLDKLPGYLMLGDILKINAHLEEDGKSLTDQRLLSKFKFLLKRKVEGSAEREYPMTKTEGDAFSYVVQLAPVFKEGNNELIIQAKSPTAQREVRHQFKVYATPAEIKISENHGKYQVKVTPYANLLRPESIKLHVELSDKSKHELKQHNNSWTVDIEKQFHETMFALNIEAVRADGKPISMSFNKVLSDKDGTHKLKLHVKKEIPLKKEINTHGQKKSEGKDVNKKKASDSKEEDIKKKSEMNWTLIIASIVVGNILIIALIGGGYVYMKRRKENLVKALADEMDDDDESKEDKVKE